MADKLTVEPSRQRAPDGHAQHDSSAGRLPAPWPVWLTIWLVSVGIGWAAQISVDLAMLALVVVTIHELGHWAAARAIGLPAQLAVAPAIGLTLFDEPQRRADAILIAAAGPIANLLTAAVCFRMANGNSALLLIGRISLIVGVANLAPIPMLDGGRIIAALTEGPGPTRAMARTMITVGGAWFAVVAGALLWPTDPVTSGTLIAIGVGSALAEWSDWTAVHRRFGTRIVRRWALIACGPATILATLAAAWLTHFTRAS